MRWISAGSRPTDFVPVRRDGLGPEGDAAEVRRLRVFFVPGYDRCNYRCPYCITGLDHARRQEWDSSHYLPVIESLAALDAFLDMVELGVGGEPLTSRTILEGVRRLCLSPRVGVVNLVTNLFSGADDLRAWLGELPAGKLALACTYHPSNAGDLGAFLDKVCFVRDCGVEVVAGCVAYPPNLPLVAEMKRRCDALGLPLFVNAFFGEHDGKQYPHGYSDDEREFLRPLVYSEHDFEYLFVPRNTRGETCGAGCSAVMVAPNGDCFRCSHEYNDGWPPLGNLLRDGGLRLLSEYLPCPADHCFCTAETVNTLHFEERYEHGRNFRLYRRRDDAPDGTGDTQRGPRA